MFNFFPFTNFHELNADWLIKTVNALKTVVDGLHDQITTALNNAQTALTASQEAYNRSTENMYRLNLLTPRVNTLENNQSTISEQVGTLTDTQSELDERVDVLEVDLEETARSVNRVGDVVATKVDDGNNTIIGAENLLTVEGPNEGDTATISGTMYTAQSALDGEAVGWTPSREAIGADPFIQVFRGNGTAVRIGNVANGRQPNDAVNFYQLINRTAPLIINVTMAADGTASVDVEYVQIQAAYLAGRNIYAHIVASPDDKYNGLDIPMSRLRDTGVSSSRSITFHIPSLTQYYPICIIRGYYPNTWNWVERT